MRLPRHGERLTGIANALGAAFLFGLGAPVAKVLLARTGPLLLAALLYLGAGGGLALVTWLTSRRQGNVAAVREAPLRGVDFVFLALLVLAGGVAAPALMTYGLQRVSAVVGSLLLNVEAPATILLAVMLFGEHLGRREVLGASVVAVGAVVLTYAPEGGPVEVRGAVAILLACLGWAIDTNLTQRLSGRDPVALAQMKGLAAGAMTLILALALGSTIPPRAYVVGGLLLGFVSYGVSVVLAIRAMRTLGAARHAAIFATAPFVGAIAAVPLLGERIGWRDALGGGLMAVGGALLLSERHAHWHVHERLEHEHAHRHDEHHEHAHGPEAAGPEPHSHVHVHEPVSHEHAHVSDSHHRHGH